MTRTLAALLTAALLVCCSDDTTPNPNTEASVSPELTVNKDGPGGGNEKRLVDISSVKTEPGNVPKIDGPKREQSTTPAGQLGAVCTQQNQTCAAGLKCVFLEAWNAPKGTCMKALPDKCSSWDDPRCTPITAGWGAMCGPYQVNSVTTYVCMLVCKLNNQSYNCPPDHTCKLMNGSEVCVPK